MPHPLFGADHWSRAARPSEPERDLLLRAQQNIDEAALLLANSQVPASRWSIQHRLSNWLPKFSAWIREMPLP